MPQKVFLESSGSGGQGLLALLIIAIPVAYIISSPRRRQGNLATAAGLPSNPSADHPPADNPRPERKTDTDKDEGKKKKEKKKVEPMISHLSEKKKLNEGIAKARTEQPDNPIYHVGHVQEDQTTPPVTPIPRDRAPVKSAARADVGTPWEERRVGRKNVGFVNSEDESAGAQVVGQRLRHPLQTKGQDIDTEYQTHANKSGRQEDMTGKKAKERAGSRAHKPPPWQIKAEIDEMTNKLKDPPVSMKEADLAILSTVVAQLCADPTTEAHAKAVKEELWNDRHGTYPRLAHEAIVAIANCFTPTLLQDTLDSLKRYADGAKMYEGFRTRQGANTPKDFKFSSTDPDMFVLAWFFDHFRLVPAKKLRMFAQCVWFQLGESDKTKAALPLLLWVEMLGHSCAHLMLLSERGLDLYGLGSRVSCAPLHRPGWNESIELFWRYRAAIFLPEEVGPGGVGRAEMLDRYGKGAKMASDAWQTISSMLLMARGYYLPNGEGLESGSRRLVFRPGWSVNAIAKVGVESALEGIKPNEQGPGPDGIPLICASRKGLESGLGAQKFYGLYMNLVQTLRPAVVTFDRRSQFSWATRTLLPDGFSEGDINTCLTALGKWHQTSRQVRSRMADEGPKHLEHDHIIFIDFNGIIPLEYKIEDDSKVFTFPSLSDFPGLKYVSIPFVSLPVNEANATADKHPEATAILTLSRSIGLWQQLKDLNLTLLVKFQQKPPDVVPEKADWTPEQWNNSFIDELRKISAKEEIEIEDCLHPDRIQWVVDDGRPIDALERFEMVDDQRTGGG